MNGIILLDESADAIASMSDEQAGKIVKALLRREAPQGLSEGAALVYPFIKGQVERLEELHEKKSRAGAMGGRPKANGKQTESKEKADGKQTESPYHTIPNHTIPISRNAKVQKAYGFSLERQDVDYNAIAQRMREEREAAE